VLTEADVVLLVGVDAVESQPVPWSYRAQVAALCEQPAGASYFRPAAQVEGDVGAAVHALAQALAPRVSRWPAVLADGFGASVVDGLRLEPPSGGLAAWQVVETVQRVVRARSEAVTVTVDAGSHRLAVAWSWRSDTPGRFLTTNGLGTMGYAVPAAIGAAVARPGETVLAFTGDGGFTLHGYELETAVRIGAKVVVVVFNDASLSQIRIKQARRAYPRSGVDFAPVRYDHIARAVGARGLRVDDANGLAEAVDDALSSPQSCVIDVVLTGGEYGEMLDTLRGRKT